MDTLLDMLSSVVQQVWEIVGATAMRITTEETYRAGFCHGMLAFGVLGVVLMVGNRAWARIHKFFSASKGPPQPSSGPSPASTAFGCLVGAAVLAVLVLLGIAFFSGRVSP